MILSNIRRFVIGPVKKSVIEFRASAKNSCVVGENTGIYYTGTLGSATPYNTIIGFIGATATILTASYRHCHIFYSRTRPLETQ